MHQHSPRGDNWLHDLCKDIHEDGSALFGRGRADWPVESLDADDLASIRSAEGLGYISVEERMDFGADRLVLRLTAAGERLLGIEPGQRRPTLVGRVASIFRR